MFSVSSHLSPWRPHCPLLGQVLFSISTAASLFPTWALYILKAQIKTAVLNMVILLCFNLVSLKIVLCGFSKYVFILMLWDRV